MPTCLIHKGTRNTLQPPGLEKAKEPSEEATGALVCLSHWTRPRASPSCAKQTARCAEGVWVGNKGMREGYWKVPRSKHGLIHPWTRPSRDGGSRGPCSPAEVACRVSRRPERHLFKAH